MAEKEKKAKAPAAPRKTAAKKTVDARKVSHEEIQQLAHRYWAERGHPHGNPEVDWYRAEHELRGKAS